MADGNVTGWKLPARERERLLERFPPRYERTIADHVTQKLGSGGPAPLPEEKSARIVGRADDDKSLECLVVEIGGTTDRPDGSIYHITWSLGADRKAKESNDVLAAEGWEPIEEPIDIDLEPARF